MMHAKLLRRVSDKPMSTIDEEKAKLLANKAINATRMIVIKMINVQIEINLLRLCRVFNTELLDRYHPSMDAKKNKPAVTKYKGPMKLMAVSDLVFKTDVWAKVKMNPKVMHPKMGKLIQAGTFDSRDFWTRGLEMMPSNVFTTKKSCPTGKMMNQSQYSRLQRRKNDKNRSIGTYHGRDG